MQMMSVGNGLEACACMRVVPSEEGCPYLVADVPLLLVVILGIIFLVGGI